MPKSKKRVRKDRAEADVIVKNPVKTTTGRIIIVLLASGFLLSVIISLVIILVQVAQR